MGAQSLWLDADSFNVGELDALCRGSTDPSLVPLSADIQQQIPVYDGQAIRDAVASDPQRVRNYQQEWAGVLLSGAGVVAIRSAIDDTAMLDQVSDTLLAIIERESQAGTGADHFAAAGLNTRLWNAHEKLCLESPELFARYNANDALALICKAWLGPAYQITTQANIVHPGGRAQVCHRDYHLGFVRNELLAEYPAHVHGFSPMLTLQGAIAHTDMPIASGPTQLLPFSQSLLPGYLAVSEDDCKAYFAKNKVQLELYKGDMLFFNPAVMHAAGDNNTDDVDRFANLLQVGSAYGRTLELLDRGRMCIRLYSTLQTLLSKGVLSEHAVQQVVEACAEGYSFPANMDLEPPVGGLSPPSQQQIMLQALRSGKSATAFSQQITEQAKLKRSS